MIFGFNFSVQNIRLQCDPVKASEGCPRSSQRMTQSVFIFSACPDNRLRKDYYPIVAFEGDGRGMNNKEMKLKIISPPLSISIAFAHNNTTMKERGFLWLGVGVSLRFFISLLWFLFLVGESVERRNNIYEWIDVFGIKSMRWDCRKHTLSFNLSLFLFISGWSLCSLVKIEDWNYMFMVGFCT